MSLVAVTLVLGACQGAFVLPVGDPTLALERFPAESVLVETKSDSGVLLRGVFVPAGLDAPLALHLMPRGVSASSGIPGLAGYPETLTALRQAGYASLAMDYRGVGASEGEPDPDRLIEDAHAQWREALHRVGGDSTRIVLRCSSLGTVAAAALCADGIQPAAIILAAPVDGTTVLGNALASRVGGFLGTILGWFVDEPDFHDPREAFASSASPMLIFLPRHDELFPPEEAATFLATLGSRATIVPCPSGHEETVALLFGFIFDAEGGHVADQLHPAETAFLDRVRAAMPRPSAR